MQQTGVFGMHGPLRSTYRFTDDYPLATLAVDPDILEQRWELTHPALVRDEPEEAGETVAAALDIAFNGGLAAAVLLSQRLIGAKRWVK